MYRRSLSAVLAAVLAVGALVVGTPSEVEAATGTETDGGCTRSYTTATYSIAVSNSTCIKTAPWISYNLAGTPLTLKGAWVTQGKSSAVNAETGRVGIVRGTTPYQQNMIL
jgi:hypothetical protein